MREQKVIDTGTVTTTSDQTGDVYLLNGVAIGTDFDARIGRKINLKSIYARFHFQSPGSQTGDHIRVMLVYDSQVNSPVAVPLVTDILKVADFLSPMNLNNRDRFKVLYDKSVTMSGVTVAAGAITGGTPIPKTLKCYKKLNLDQIFSGTAATIGSIATGAIYLLVISLQDDLNTTYYNVRIRFEDA